MAQARSVATHSYSQSLKRNRLPSDGCCVEYNDARALLTSSSLAWLEVWCSLRRAAVADVEATGQRALAGVAEFELSEAVLARARRVRPDELRSLDASTWRRDLQLARTLCSPLT